jgi:formylglycine-generating enzyme
VIAAAGRPGWFALVWVGLPMIAGCGCPLRDHEPSQEVVRIAEPPEDMVVVEGGTFSMGALEGDRDARDWEKPRHDVVVSSFYIDRHEVTVERYAEAVAAGAVAEPGCWPHDEWGQRLCNWAKPERAQHPVNGVNWESASSYCAWKGRRLPTEGEFEYLLRHGREGAVYPWGDEPAPPPGFGSYADLNAPRDRSEGAVLPGYDDGFALTAPVGSFEPDPFGAYDISGNIWEWCGDWFDERYYGSSPTTDPTGPVAGERRTLRGGNFYCIREELRISERHHKKPSDQAVYTGFRCASDIRVVPTR